MTDLDHYAWHNRYLNDKPVVTQPAKSTTPSPGTIKLNHNQTPPAKYTTKHLGHTATAVGAVGAYHLPNPDAIGKPESAQIHVMTLLHNPPPISFYVVPHRKAVPCSIEVPTTFLTCQTPVSQPPGLKTPERTGVRDLITEPTAPSMTHRPAHRHDRQAARFHTRKNKGSPSLGRCYDI